MNKLKFDSPEEARDWLDENITQKDSRYTPDIELSDILAYFLYNKAVIVEEKIIPENTPSPSSQILTEIGEPQSLHKYIALKLLELEGIGKQNIFFEYRIYGRAADIYANQDERIILVECCSCYLKKIIDYLEEKNAELWIITNGYGPWDKDFPGFEENKSSWFMLRRGPNWNEYYNFYRKHVEMEIKKIKNPLDNL